MPEVLPPPDMSRQQIRRLCREVEKTSSWIYKVFLHCLQKPRGRTTACCLGIGSGEELIQLRKFLGPTASIWGFDLTLDKYAKVAVAGSKSQYSPKDIRQVDDVIQVIGGFPNVVVCRHPRLLHAVDFAVGIITYQDWWLESLTEWAQKMQQQRGQMLITTFTAIEMERLKMCFVRHNLNFQTHDLDIAPKSLTKNYLLLNGQNIVARPDNYALTLQPNMSRKEN